MKVIIFDFDDTLYNGNVWVGWADYMKQFFLHQFHNDQQKVDSFMDKYSMKTYCAQRTAEALIKEFGSAESLSRYRQENIYPFGAPDLRFIEEDFLRALAEKYPLYIVSNSTLQDVCTRMRDNNFSPDIFKGIYENEFRNYDVTKFPYFKEIMEREGVEASDVLMVGDNPINDILPAEKIGFKTMLVKTLEDVKKGLLPYM